MSAAGDGIVREVLQMGPPYTVRGSLCDVVRCDLLSRRPHAPPATLRGQVHWHLRAIIKKYRDALAAHAILYRLFDIDDGFKKKYTSESCTRRGLMDSAETCEEMTRRLLRFFLT
ncbi:unnamed protein product [Danaus chrysippus]|uniref:(African queen) hypothetical protein n=1 Tax=Danaus chrysippus TaxID=151541 RepID=A0A8J2VWT8_9NEOP|nr:unnamed protein product [Danaus chrysippus]